MLHYVRTGQGPTLVLLHYFGGSSRTWQPVMDRLAGTYDCIAPDLRGWGSSQGEYTSFTVDSMADDVSELLGSLSVLEYALAGHSMGGKVALALAARRPPGLTRLLLAAPSPLTPEPMSDSDRARLRSSWGDAAACRKLLGEITVRPLPDTLAEDTIADNLRASEAAWAAWPNTGSREDLGVRYGQIVVPTHVLAGEHDRPLSPAFLQSHVADRISGASLETAPGASHLLPLEAPDSVARFLRTHNGE